MYLLFLFILPFPSHPSSPIKHRKENKKKKNKRTYHTAQPPNLVNLPLQTRQQPLPRLGDRRLTAPDQRALEIREPSGQRLGSLARQRGEHGTDVAGLLGRRRHAGRGG